MGYTQTRKNEGTEIARVTRCASGSLEGKALLYFKRNFVEKQLNRILYPFRLV